MGKISIVTIFGGSSELAKHIALDILKTTDHQIIYSYCNSKALVEEWFIGLPLASKNRIKIRQVDATDSKQVDLFFNQELRDHHLNSVISCIGYHSPSLLPLTTDAMWQKHIDVNLNGSFYIARAAVEIFNLQKNGCIILMSSIAKTGARGMCAYSASKAGIDGLTGTIAKEYGLKNINAYNLSLGVLETEKTARRVKESLLNKIGDSDNKFVKVELVSSTILDLINGKGNFMNGSSIDISGGQSLDE